MEKSLKSVVDFCSLMHIENAPVVQEQLEILEKLVDKSLEREEVEIASDAIVKLMINMPLLDTKSHKKFCKVVKRWRNFDLFEEKIKIFLQHFIENISIFTLKQIKFINVVIEDLDGTTSMLLTNCLPSIIEKISCTLNNANLCKDNRSEKELYYKTLKVALQVLQKYKEVVADIISDVKVITNLTIIGEMCIKFIYGMKNEQDLSQMCGTVVGFMLGYHKDISNATLVLNQIIFNDGNYENAEVMPNVCLNVCDGGNVGQSNRSIWLIRGVLSSFPLAIFYALQSTNCEKANPHFFQLIYDKILSVCKSDGKLQYHAFQALNLLWKNALKYLSNGKINKELFEEQSNFIQSTVMLIWDNWDSQVTGATDTLMQVLNNVLDVNQTINHSDDLINYLLDHLLLTSNYVKGKYGPLSLLISKYGPEIVFKRNSHFTQTLIPGLGINHLASVVSKVYKSIVNNLFQENDTNFDIEKWEEVFASTLLEAVLHDLPFIRQNALHHWVPVHIRLHKHVFPRLVQLLSNRKGCYDKHTNINVDSKICLSSLIGVLKVARCSGCVCFSDLDLKVLRQGMACYDADTRADAFFILCKSSKKCEVVSTEEFDLLFEHIPLNLNSDCASFRHEFIFSIRAILVRIQCSVVVAEKQMAASQYVGKCVDFISWLNEICFNSLQICSSYQRKITALTIYDALLCHFYESENLPTKKAMITHEDFQRLLNVLEQHLVDLKSDDYLKLILSLFEDVVPDVREYAYKILMLYFPLERLLKFKVNIQKRYFKLLSSPKAQDTESGSLLIEFFLSKFILKNDVHNVSDIGSMSPNSPTQCLNLLREEILENMQVHLAKFQNNILDASSHHPLFGWVLSMSQCLNKVLKLRLCCDAAYANEYRKLLSCAANQATTAINLLLHEVFSCTKVTDGEQVEFIASADFEEISRRIYSIINHEFSGSNSEDFQNTLLSNQHEVILSSCWLTLKNCCFLLSSLGSFIIDSNLTESDQQADARQMTLTNICNTLVTVLTMCRHRGVIESCRTSFTDLCVSLFASKHFYFIPVELLDSILELQNRKYNNNMICGATITRRSAGLPLITDAILSASVISGVLCKELLQKSLTTFLESVVFLRKLDETKLSSIAELPQVDALYILRQIFQNNVLGPHVTEFLTPVFIAAINCLSSTLWIVRNASIHLLGALSSRMLGQKHIEDKTFTSTTNSLTASEFFSRFPDLFDFINKSFEEDPQMSCSVDNIKTAHYQVIKPDSYAITCLISKLACKNECVTNQLNLSVISKSLVDLLKCPLYFVRSIAVQAIIGLHSPEKIMCLLEDYISSIPSNLDKDDLFVTICQNELHGWLSLTLVFIQQYSEMMLEQTGFCNLLLCRSQLGNLVHNPCPFTAAIYLKIYRELMKWPQSADEETILNIAIMSIDLCCSQMKQVGYTMYMEEAIKLSLHNPSHDRLLLVLEKCFKQKHESFMTILQKTCLICLTDYVQANNNEDTAKTLLINLWKKNDVHETCVENAALKLFISLHDFFAKTQFVEEEFLVFSSHILFTHKSNKCLSMKCSIMKAISVIVACGLPQVTFIDLDVCIKIWISEISTNTSNSRSSEPLRKMSADSLNLAGCQVLKWISNQCSSDNSIGKHTRNELVGMACNICEAAIWLMHDEQGDVRESACVFVSTLCMDEDFTNVLQHNVATKKLLEFMAAYLQPHVPILNMLMSFCIDITIPKLPSKSVSLFKQEAFNMYMEQIQLVQSIKPFITELVHKIEDIPSSWISNHLDNINEKLCQIHKCILILEWRDLYEFTICTLLYIEVILQAIQRKTCKKIFQAHLETVKKYLGNIQVDSPCLVNRLIESVRVTINHFLSDSLP